MARQFRIGQVVGFRRVSVLSLESVREYKVLRLFPHLSGEPLYGIKTITEPLERIAKESELVAAPIECEHRVLQFHSGA